MMKALVACCQRYTNDWSKAVILARWTDEILDKEYDIDAWDQQYEEVGSNEPEDLGMLCPTEKYANIYYWEGTLFYPDNGTAFDGDACSSEWHGKWRLAEDNEIEAFRTGVIFSDWGWKP
jgi:hypothetical protein